MSVIRFFMLLSLVVWLGGITFFAFVLAPTVFAVLPTRHLAGSVVSRTLPLLHWIGVISGLVFAVTSMAYARVTTGAAEPLAARHILVYVMILITLISQFVIGRPMMVLRAQMGVIDDLPENDARRVEFNRLHQWSARLEGAVFVLGLALLYLTAQRLT